MAGDVVGGSEFASAMRRLPAQLESDLEAVTPAIASAIIDAASPPRVSGTLDRSQSVDVVPGGATIVASAPYAGVIRFGWPARNIAANDWITPAVTRVETKAAQLAGDAVTHSLETLT